jgi:transposase-like protein
MAPGSFSTAEKHEVTPPRGGGRVLAFRVMVCHLSPSAEGEARVRVPALCPSCHSNQVKKRGKTATREQRYRCQNRECSHQSFLLAPASQGRLPEIKQQVIELSLNGGGNRDTARVLPISLTAVRNELKEKGLH